LEEKEVHLVKKVSKELGMTYKELAKEIGYSESILRQSVSHNRISSPLEKVLYIYLKNHELEQEINKIEAFKNYIKSFLN
jgi:ribosome-binding protein aMBF1 (putative translation factor)